MIQLISLSWVVGDLFKMGFFSFYNNFKKQDFRNHEILIVKLNENIIYTQKQLNKYINKYLQNEEKWKLINYLIQNINSTLEIKDLTKLINSQILKLVEADVCRLFLYEETSQSIVSKYHDEEFSSTQIDYMNGFILDKNALLPKFINSIPNFSNSNMKNFLNENLNINYHIIPILNDFNFFGIIFLYKEASILNNEEINILEIIAKNISMTLKNSELYEKLKQSKQNTVQFIASLTHEFKTPLNSIIGFSDIIKSTDKLDKKEISDYGDHILNCSKHLLKLIEDIQDASIAESGQFTIYYEKFNTKTLIKEIISHISSPITQKDLKIKSHLIDNIINADSKRFKQVIYNLLSNAIKFSHEGGKLEIFSYLEDNNFHFEITNHGKIIKPEDRDKIFKLYYQSDSHSSHSSEGAGIGLSICKKIISQLGGKIDFTSEEKSGTTFFFQIPIDHNNINNSPSVKSEKI